MVMNPQQQQQQQVSPQLPPGVQNAYVTYGYNGARVMLTLESKPRRKLMVFAVLLLILGPLIVAGTSGCMALKHYYIAYGYASGVLVSIPLSLYTSLVALLTCQF